MRFPKLDLAGVRHHVLNRGTRRAPNSLDNGPTDICNIAAAKNFSPDCKVENGFADPNTVREASIAHVVAWLGLQVGKQTKYQAHLASGQGFVWQTKAF